MKNVGKFYTCSTTHLPCETAEKMESGLWPSVTMESEFGFLVYVPKSGNGLDVLRARGMDCPAYLTVVQLAQDAGCEYILFDRDVDPVPYLQKFDW